MPEQVLVTGSKTRLFGYATNFRGSAGFGNTSAAILLVFGIKIIAGTGLSVPCLSRRRSASVVDDVSRYATPWRSSAGPENTSAALLLVFGIKTIAGTGLLVPGLSRRRSASGADDVSRYATPWRSSAGAGNTSATLLLVFWIETIVGTGLLVPCLSRRRLASDVGDVSHSKQLQTRSP